LGGTGVCSVPARTKGPQIQARWAGGPRPAENSGELAHSSNRPQGGGGPGAREKGRGTKRGRRKGFGGSRGMGEGGEADGPGGEGRGQWAGSAPAEPEDDAARAGAGGGTGISWIGPHWATLKGIGGWVPWKGLWQGGELPIGHHRGVPEFCPPRRREKTGGLYFFTGGLRGLLPAGCERGWVDRRGPKPRVAPDCGFRSHVPTGTRAGGSEI